VVGALDDLGEVELLVLAGDGEAVLLEDLLVGGVELVAVAVALEDDRRAVGVERAARLAGSSARRAASCRRGRPPSSARRAG
jgi:hypothetical protein